MSLVHPLFVPRLVLTLGEICQKANRTKCSNLGSPKRYKGRDRMRMILLGPPGAGKGTQAANLSKALRIPHISTGDIFRANIKSGTELGLLAKSYIDDGKLVPDDVTISIVEKRLEGDDCGNGFIMDGFPRTIPQAEMFDVMLKRLHCAVELVVNIQVPDSVIIKRMSGRRMCPCGRTYHVVNNPPLKEGVCDVCGNSLYIREDDREETVKERLKTYHQQTSPLIDYYEKKKLVLTFDGMKPIDETTKEILAVVDKKKE